MHVVLAIWEAKIRRIMVPGQPRQYKFMRLHLDGEKLGICHPNYCRSVKQKNHYPGQVGEKAKYYLQNNQSKKRLGGMHQVVEV
jgi:hypothetical protein